MGNQLRGCRSADPGKEGIRKKCMMGDSNIMYRKQTYQGLL
jgi:hypothetical protein